MYIKEKCLYFWPCRQISRSRKVFVVVFFFCGDDDESGVGSGAVRQVTWWILIDEHEFGV